MQNIANFFKPWIIVPPSSENVNLLIQPDNDLILTKVTRLFLENLCLNRLNRR